MIFIARDATLNIGRPSLSLFVAVGPALYRKDIDLDLKKVRERIIGCAGHKIPPTHVLLLLSHHHSTSSSCRDGVVE